MSSPMPTGEIQGKADTERALDAYQGVAAAYQDDLAQLETEAGDLCAAANRLCDQLGGADLGDAMMSAVAAIEEQAGVALRVTAELGPADEAVLAGLHEFAASVAAHDAVEAAAVDNTDGGTTEYHAA